MSEDTQVIEKTKTKTEVARPKKWTVVFHNDDYTPMEYVIRVIVHVFNVSDEDAVAVMMKVHNNGSANIGCFSKEIAETKSLEVNEISRNHGHPLKTTFEPID